MSRDFIGNSVSVGTGIKAYFRINGTYLKDGKTSVQDVVKAVNADLKVTGFIRYSL